MIKNIEGDPQADKIQAYMNVLTGGKTVPRVFVGGKFIGGGTETATMHQSGALKGLLQKAGAIRGTLQKPSGTLGRI